MTTSTPTVATDTTGTTTSAATPAAAKPPVAAPLATAVALVVAIVMIALGVVAGRDVLLAAGAITGTPWIAAVLHALNGLTAAWWMLPAGIAVALLGLLLVFAAVTPRRRTHRPLRVAGTWITPRDLTRLARAAAEPITGVRAATATGSGRTLTLTVTPVGGYDTAALHDTVAATVTEALAPLATPPRLKIRITKQES